MQLSRFVITYRDVRPGEHVLYDVISDAYAGVDPAGLAAIDRWRESSPRDDAEADCQRTLREMGFLVENAEQDDARLRRFLEQASQGIPGTMSIILMPTLQCNLACNYCFQKDHPAFTKMRERTEGATVEWILRKVDAAACRRLLVHYFGGEPLTRKDYLLRTAEIFSASMKARGGAFEWEITTNAVGMDVEFVRAMRTHGPGSIKVTLDGDKETHDEARVHRDGRGTFDTIFQKTIDVARHCPDVNLRIGGNFKPDQVASYERLLDRLEAEGLRGLLESIRFKPIIDTDDDECGSCTSCAKGTEAEDAAVMQLADSVQHRKLARHPPRSTPTGPCELHWKNNYIIDPEGRVYKCPAVAGRPEMAVATVMHAECNEKIAPLVELRPWEQCGPCPFMPVCVGGCLGGKFLQTGRRDQVFCQKSLFEKAFRQEISARYLEEHKTESVREAA